MTAGDPTGRFKQQERTTPTILVVDDEPHIRYMLELKLRSAGYSVLTATNGIEAYEIASRRYPDAVVTDFQMPGCDGMVLCRQLSSNESTSVIPVLMLTARGHRIAPEDTKGTNIRQLLAKPFSPRDLLKKIEKLLSETNRAAPGASSRERS